MLMCLVWFIISLCGISYVCGHNQLMPNEFQYFRSFVRFISWWSNHKKYFYCEQPQTKYSRTWYKVKDEGHYGIIDGDLAVKNTEFSLINFQSEIRKLYLDSIGSWNTGCFIFSINWRRSIKRIWRS